MALAVPLPDPATLTTEAVISKPDLDLIKALIANIVALEARVTALE